MRKLGIAVKTTVTANIYIALTVHQAPFQGFTYDHLFADGETETQTLSNLPKVL